MALSEEQMIELYDKQSLHDNLMLYCRGVDRMDKQLIQSVYWPDAIDDHGSYIGSGFGWADAALSKGTNNYSVNHHVSNILSEINGHHAKRESMFLCAVVYKNPDAMLFLGGRYRDLCEKRDGVWKILRRTCIWDWSETRPVKIGWDMINMPDVTNWGSFYPEDPIYGDWSVSTPTAYSRKPLR